MENSKLKKGDFVLFRKGVYEVQKVTYIAHPELMLGRGKEGWYALIESQGLAYEDIESWVNQKRLKKLTNKQATKKMEKDADN